MALIWFVLVWAPNELCQSPTPEIHRMLLVPERFQARGDTSVAVAARLKSMTDLK